MRNVKREVMMQVAAVSCRGQGTDGNFLAPWRPNLRLRLLRGTELTCTGLSPGPSPQTSWQLLHELVAAPAGPCHLHPSGEAGSRHAVAYTLLSPSCLPRPLHPRQTTLFSSISWAFPLHLPGLASLPCALRNRY